MQQLLYAAAPEQYHFKEITVFGGEHTLEKLPKRDWVRPVHEPGLDGGLSARILWRYSRLNNLARRFCDILLIPGGLSGPQRLPWVTMCRNMLPFEAAEKKRYALGLSRLRLELLGMLYGRSFENADGVIFLTRYAQRKVCVQLRKQPKQMTIIPHGVDQRFFMPPRNQVKVEDRSWNQPFKLLYLSTINNYKHQWHVAEAVWMLRNEGLPLRLDFIGGGYEPALSRLHQTIERLDPNGEWLIYQGRLPFDVLHNYYHEADAFIFASSCENMPNILLEAMGSGLPIACSDRRPMPDILGRAGIYFNPEQPKSIANALKKLLENRQMREEIAKEAYETACNYSWEHCAAETFGFLRKVYEKINS